MPLNLSTLNDAEKFQEHFVRPLVDAVRAEIKPLVLQSEQQGLTLKQHADSIGALRENQGRATRALAAVVVVIQVGWNVAWEWLSKSAK